MRYLLGVAAAVALMAFAGGAGAAVMKPAGVAQAAVDLSSLELVARKKKRASADSFCVACPIPFPLMQKGCEGTAASCMAANPLCYVNAGACGKAAAAAKPAKAKKAKKAKKKAEKKEKPAKEPAKAKAPAKAKEKKK